MIVQRKEVIKTGISYRKKVGNERHQMVMAGLRKLPEVTVHRYIIRLPKIIHFDQRVKYALTHSLMQTVTFEHRTLFDLNRNNAGELLLDAPDVPGCDAAIGLFLKKLEGV